MTNFNPVVKQTTISTRIDSKETSDMQNYSRAININGSFGLEVQPELFPTKYGMQKQRQNETRIIDETQRVP